MKTTEGRLGRVFIIRLETGDVIPQCIERFAQEKGVKAGHVILLGGIGGGEIVVGPRNTTDMPPDPMFLPLDGAHEIAAVGVIALDESGKPILHVHGALGRSGQTITGCLRQGVSTWLIGEAILLEVVGVNAVRIKDKQSGFTLLELGVGGSR